MRPSNMLQALKNRKQGLASMMMLYSGKASSLLITLFFIPFFHKILGSQEFGYVAIVLSMQALLTMLDFGLSSVLAREFAAKQMKPVDLRSLLQTAILALTIVYSTIIVLIIFADVALPFFKTRKSDIYLSILFFFFMVLQNLYYTATLANQEYLIASGVQIFGNITRAIVSALLLKFVSASFFCFISTQAFISFIHLLIAKFYFNKNYPRTASRVRMDDIGKNISDALSLIKKNKSLALYTFSGAAAMQLDKPIIGAFLGAKEVSTYYLAMTFCLVPSSIFAAPVSQFYQPKIINLFFSPPPDEELPNRIIKQFSLLLGITVLIPAVIQWLLKPDLLHLWLHGTTDIGKILVFTRVLLPGITIGALGYIPLALLLAAKDYIFQARVSIFFTVSTLSLVFLSAYSKNLALVCLVYSLYHALSTIILWLRATQLRLVQAAAINSALIMILLNIIAISTTLLSHFL